MSIAAWSMLWQIVVAVTGIAFLVLAVRLGAGAIREAGEMFDDLSEDNTPQE